MTDEEKEKESQLRQAESWLDDVLERGEEESEPEEVAEEEKPENEDG